VNYPNQLKESKMTGKMKGIPALNTNTLSNPFCGKMRKKGKLQKDDIICFICYSASMLKTSRQNCVPSWERNSKTLSAPIPIENLPIINAHSFRFHGHGELINYTHLENFMNIVNKNPDTHFALWTKRIGYVRKWLRLNERSRNVIFIYSNPSTRKVLNEPPEGFDKVFNSVYDDIVKTGQTPCTGIKCVNCLACYRHNEHKVIIEKVKKR
jgi:hypothetical protein